jgi:hypothetical protein
MEMEGSFPAAARVDYSAVMEEIRDCDLDSAIAHLSDTLPYLWVSAYHDSASPRQTDICRIRVDTFEYIYDDYATLEAKGIAPDDTEDEARIVAVLGQSASQKKARDDSRLRGWVGATGKYFGDAWDKGHFMAHSIGGSVDHAELNVFIQKRGLNRGWTDQGKRFRAMEQYCERHPSTFCFSRPIYTDGTAKPSFLEFGVLKSEKDLWVECFENYYVTSSNAPVLQ